MTFLHWFYLGAPVEIVGLGRNFLRWGWHYFSIGYLALRLLAPWHRDITPYGRGFDLKRFLHTLGWNLISRVIGAVLRIFVIVAGLLAELVIIILGALVFVVWILLPLLIPFLLISGLFMLV